MKRTLLSLTLALFLLPALSGCAGLYANVREVEQLLVIQTMGLDGGEGGVRLSLASGAGIKAAGSPTRLHASAPTVSAAIEQIRSRANEDDLFCAHVGHVLIGEGAAESGVDAFLSYICRSRDLRLSVPLYLVRGGSAEEAVLGVGDESYGICDALDAADADVRLRGDGRLTSAAEIVSSLARCGSALICAVEYRPSAEEARSGGAAAGPVMTVAPAGYGVLKGDRLCGGIDREQAVGVGLLLNDTGPCELLVRDREGRPVTLTLERGGSELRPLWSDAGALEGLEISVWAVASAAELGVSGQGGDSAWEDDLTARLEAELARRVGSVLQLSRELGADFLDLGGRVERADPRRFAALEPSFGDLLPDLRLRLSVSGRLAHTGDIRGGSA